MFRPLSIALGLRYTRAKKLTHFISFVALTSMLGIAIGVTVLITVLSVMNGFNDTIKSRFFVMAPQIVVTGAVKDWLGLAETIKTIQPAIQDVAPFVAGQGLLVANGESTPIAISGIEPTFEKKVSQLDQLMLYHSRLDSLQSKTFNIVIGEKVALRLGLEMGDKVTLMIPKGNVSIIGVQPRFKQFTVSGIFSAGNGFGFDSQIAFIALRDAQVLYGLNDRVSGIKLRVNDVYQAPAISKKLLKDLPIYLDVSDWSMQFGAFFKALQLEKNMMFLILLLIIAVAAFNLVSSLVMLVNDKRSDIAILRTIGATPRFILSIFIVQGFIVGFLGTLFGTIAGVILSYNVTEIVNALQHLLGVQFLSENVFFVDYLPSKILISDLVKVVSVSLFFSFIATLYPARKAAHINPVEALRYE